MVRMLTALVVGILVAGTVSAQEAKKLTLRWHGHSFFELVTSKGTRIVFDPHAIEEYGRKSIEADLVLSSHFHNDHTRLDWIDNRDKIKRLFGLKVENKRFEWNLIEEKFKDAVIHTVGVYHDTLQGMERGKVGVFVVEVDGLRIVHLGDLGHQLSKEQLQKIGVPDVLMIPVGGVYTINGSEAKKVIEQLKPKMYILPMHFSTKVFDPVLPINEFLQDQNPDQIKRMQDSNELRIETNFKPAEPFIVLLGWKPAS